MDTAIIPRHYLFDVEEATERRIVNILSPIALILATLALSQALNRLQHGLIALTLFKIAIVVVEWLVVLTIQPSAPAAVVTTGKRPGLGDGT